MIFQLVEEGKLKLTDTLDKFFPQIPNAARITIAQILAHRSGIHDLEPDGSWGKQPRTKDEVVARIAQGQPDFEPDARHLYSNAGYVLVGLHRRKSRWQTVSGSPEGKNHFQDRAQGYLPRRRKHGSRQERSSFL